MPIIPYAELKDKSDLFLLFAKSFDWYATPRSLDQWVASDFRLKSTPVGFCALVDGKVESFIGTMEIPTRNKHGERETVGGIWLVATKPSANRQGLGKKLLEHCEEYFRQKGYRFCTLTTSRNIIAYRWYREVGYDVVEYPDAYPHYYKIPRSAAGLRVQPAKSQAKASGFDYEKTLELFDKYMEDRCGFVYRDIGSLKAREQFGFYDSRYSRIHDDGYMLANSQSGSLRISEVISLKSSTARSLLRSAAGMTKGGLFARFVFDPDIARLFERSGYHRDLGTYDVLMAKPLTGVSFDDIYDRSFICTRVDFF
jgi:ribosomal protein S18 acetylase RimI-like enzyme